MGFIAKGWTIVRRKISANGRVKIAVYITFYFALNISTVFWDGLGLTDGQVTYFYESSSGVFLLVLRALTVIWFGYSCFTTLKNFSLKKRFYTKLIILGSLWILSFPATVLICLALNEVYRFK